ncbi:hypothetical protein [Vibrio sp. WXL103]|uniref:hypothetical protein n=1 Tax=Vibrio sp. WXL103 TaxID=3450710 RepID=UPI003EC8774B
MSSDIHALSWNDASNPHKIWLEPHGASTTLNMRVVKDLPAELLTLELPISYQAIAEHWKGEALAISPAYDDGWLFTQTRVLFNLPTGCVVWAVTHIMLPNGKKMSADKLAFVPNLKATQQQLLPL